MRFFKLMTAILATSILAGCSMTSGDSKPAVTTGLITQTTIALGTKPVTQPTTQATTQPDTQPATQPATQPDTQPDTQPEATKPEPTNPINPADIVTGHAYDTYTVRDWTWNASAADYYPEEEKLVFLTFDDGPSWTVTPKVLDILEANNVPGTFFYYTNGDLSDRKETVNRTLHSGHSIAIHTNSHDYGELYPDGKADVEAILSDVTRATNKIQAVLDEPWAPTVYRFPGGSFSWTGSDKTRKAMNEAKQALADKGLIYIDWNSLSGDSDTGNKDKSPEGLVNFTIQQTENAYGHVIVVLMHDAEHSKNTPKALQGIIDYFKEEGYTFGSLK